MKRIWILFLCIHYTAFSSFFEDDDPTRYYHVNVITGHLELNFQDIKLKSPVPFVINRSYTSQGALERTSDDVDLELKYLRNSGWMFQGGWSFLSHLNLLIDFPNAYLCEKNSSHLIPYSHYKRKNGYNYLHPKIKNNKAFGNLSARNKIKHSHIKMKGNTACLKLPDGSRRYFSRGATSVPDEPYYWRLDVEVLPSKHRLVYHYSKSYPSGNLVKIEFQNPKGTKVFATIDFDHSSFEKERILKAKTSDGKTITYQMGPDHEKRSYLQNVTTSIRPEETLHYHPGRKGIGARLEKLNLGDAQPVMVEYHLPPNKKKERKWAKNGKKHQQGDKVKSLQFPDPFSGQPVEVAQFSYFPGYTEVKDHEGVVTRFIHDKEKLLAIEYYGNDMTFHSKVVFEWEDDNLRAKKLLDGNEATLFSKSFFYDEKGNITRELWEDHQTNVPPIERKFAYSKRRLILSEEESDGLTHQYQYYAKTDLPTSKLTLYNGKVLLREFWHYNADHLLVLKITDDGTSLHERDLTGVNERKIERYALDPKTGFCTSQSDFFLDLATSKEILHRQCKYTYNANREIASETIICGSGGETYTTYFEYDQRGHLIKKTTPLGRKNSYTYDEQGNLLSSKEVGSPLKTFEYDYANRPIFCHEGDQVIKSSYDMKGRLLSQTDKLGNTTTQVYDCFGRSLQSKYPFALDQNDHPYQPEIDFVYDVQNNLIATTNPQGETTRTEYNILRKPTQINYPDGNWIRHSYHSNGDISETTYSDETTIRYTYDPLQRMTSKITVSPEGEILSEESWVYSTSHLLSYTNPSGLTTCYKYDLAGRKIAEKAEDRLINYAYDAFGYLERVTSEGHSKVQLHNCEGEIIEQWEEDSRGKIENRMLFFYDEEGRKVKAIRFTSWGEAEDYFKYDELGRLTQHIDPLGAKTKWIYSQTVNSLGQIVEQKMSIDPLGNAVVETQDASGRIVKIEKKDPEGQIISREAFSYDKAGNKVKRVVTVFDRNSPIRTHTTQWKYNERGLVLEELEENEKRTTYEYDTRGRVIRKTLPSGTSLYQSYDGLDRLLTQKSSDGTIDYEYFFEKGASRVIAVDHIRQLTWRRTFNVFEEMTSETTPDGRVTRWDYDRSGRCIELTLPDCSSIRYAYTDLHLFEVGRHTSEGRKAYSHRYTDFDENGHVSREALIDGLGTITTHHDLLERVESVKTPWNQASIEYGPSGLVMKTENSLFKNKVYQYDPLNQLIQEGETTYQFDSLGNPLDAEINPFNQVVNKEECHLTYNANGNPIEQIDDGVTATYTYDALGRLTSIEIPNKKKILYTYDPFSRLYSREVHLNQPTFFFGYANWSQESLFYLYDKEKEIGAVDAELQLRELKVNGLGILGEIGAAVALELEGKTYLPLHDFSGNIIALVSSDGSLIEKCEVDAFGKALLSTPSLNPWRFHSKRTEEGLIYFGERFYNPKLGRWLTPDPAGSLESPNLYLYTRNSPLNRLDLFGLYSEDFRTEFSISSLMENSTYVTGKAYYKENEVDWLIQSNNFHKLQFSPEELESGKIDILEHFQDLFPKDGQGVGICLFTNGIGNTNENFIESSEFIATHAPKDGLFIAMRTPSKGLGEDIKTTNDERRRKRVTPEVASTSQTLVAVSETLAKVSPKMLIAYLTHSRGGVIGCYAIDLMDDQERKVLEKMLLWAGIAPAEPLKKMYAKDSINFYSELDGITGPPVRDLVRMQSRLPEDQWTHNIEFISCTSKLSEQIAYTWDHALMGNTYQNKIKKVMAKFEGKYGFYEEKR